MTKALPVSHPNSTIIQWAPLEVVAWVKVVEIVLNTSNTINNISNRCIKPPNLARDFRSWLVILV